MLRIVGIGSAIVDLFIASTAPLLSRFNLMSGRVTPVSKLRAHQLLEEGVTLHSGKAGGLTANVLRSLSLYGADTAFFGTLGNDRHADVFSDALQKAGVRNLCAVRTGETAFAVILPQPEHGSAIAYYPGIAQRLSARIVSQLLAMDYDLLYSDAYQLMDKQDRQIIDQALTITRKKGKYFAFSLPSIAYIIKYSVAIRQVVRRSNLVFGNLQEYLTLWGVEDLEQLLSVLRQEKSETGFVITRDKHGAVFAQGGKTCHILPAKAKIVRDSTGAGDVFAAKFVFGWLNNYNIETIGSLSAEAAASSLAQLGTDHH